MVDLPLGGFAHRILGVRLRRKVVYVDGPPINHGAPCHPSPADRSCVRVTRDRPVGGRQAQRFVLHAVDLRVVRATQSSRVLGYRIQDRLESGR